MPTRFHEEMLDSDVSENLDLSRTLLVVARLSGFTNSNGRFGRKVDCMALLIH